MLAAFLAVRAQPAGAGAPQGGIAEPLFAFLFALAEGDSLGAWSGRDLARQVAATGRASRFPLETIVRIARRPAGPQEASVRPGARLERIWEVELAEDLERPLPYSILGYHPGSLHVSRLLVLSEWALGDVRLRLRGSAEPGWREVQEVRVLRLDEGHVILDADAWVDRLLGSALDDSWTLGFALGRQGPTRLALAINVGREGRRLYGEMDLVRDEVRAHGRPLAEALSRKCRPLTAPDPGKPDRAWQDWR